MPLVPPAVRPGLGFAATIGSAALFAVIGTVSTLALQAGEAAGEPGGQG